MKDSVGWFSLLSWHSHKMHQNATRTVAPLLGRSKSNVQVEQVQTEKQLYMAKYGNWTNRTNWKPGYEYESGGHDTPIVLRVHFFITEIALLVFVTIFLFFPVLHHGVWSSSMIEEPPWRQPMTRPECIARRMPQIQRLLASEVIKSHTVDVWICSSDK